jgi:cyanophycin synthetase
VGRRVQPVSLVELRILDGPNLYFTTPAVKLTLAVPGWARATEDRVAAAALAAGAPAVRPGRPGSEQRLRFVARIAAHLTRSLARETGTRLAVRARVGPEPGEIVVAYPWRRRAAAEALGKEVGELLRGSLDSRRDVGKLLAQSAGRLERVEPGPSPSVPAPDIPVIAVTGTNGKTTTVRLLAHLARTAGMTVAFSSTDGVYVNDRLVEKGDYSGFGGAARALAQAGVEVAVLETARGGILLRGIGTQHNDVAVVTNVSADHLNLQGIRTLDQLAEVKAAITRITRREGWDVLNADDPRVLAMRRGARGRPWLFSLDQDHPGLRSALEERGRATTVIDRWMTVLTPDGRSHPLLPLEDVPMTLAGISGHNVQNAMAAASAALAVGLPETAVVKGLRSFVLNEETNPGRANLYELDGRVVVIDYAHNEAGLQGMLEICRGLVSPGGEVWVAFCTAGDRTDDVLHGMGYLAARGADHVVIAEMRAYLRGRDPQDLVDRLRAGALDGGAKEVPVFEDELHALDRLLVASRSGDVVGVNALSQRAEIFEAMRERGAARLVPQRVRALVRRARGNGGSTGPSRKREAAGRRR